MVDKRYWDATGHIDVGDLKALLEASTGDSLPVVIDLTGEVPKITLMDDRYARMTVEVEFPTEPA